MWIKEERHQRDAVQHGVVREIDVYARPQVIARAQPGGAAFKPAICAARRRRSCEMDRRKLDPPGVSKGVITFGEIAETLTMLTVQCDCCGRRGYGRRNVRTRDLEGEAREAKEKWLTNRATLYG